MKVFDDGIASLA